MALLCAVSATALGACGSVSETVSGPTAELPAVPAAAPERPAGPRHFPAVHDMPPPRAAVVLDGLEQQRMETELMAARQQQKTLATAPLEFEPG